MIRMSELARGLTLLYEGQRWAARHRRDWRFGMLPALVTLAGYLVALAALALWGEDLIRSVTGFADGWGDPWTGAFRVLLGVLLFGGGLALAVITFTAATLAVGQPFYEALAGRVEAAEGDAPVPPERPFWREIGIAVRDGLRIFARAACWAVLLFAAGLLPLVGQTVVPVIGWCVSGWFLTLELAGVALQRRDVPLTDQLRLFRAHKPLVLGFGAPLAVAFLVPFVAVPLMPGAVAGATLLVRELLPPEAPEAGARPGGEARTGDAAFRDTEGRTPGPATGR
jgi:CysZ protein